MARLSTTLNDPTAFLNMKRKAQQRVEVDLDEVERVIELARRTPGLLHYEDALRRVSVFFQVATTHYQQNDPAGLNSLVEFWERYRASVIQRHASVTPVELRAADKVVADVFDQFLAGVPEQNLAYAKDVKPLVYGGEGGLGAYFTHPPGWNRPFAIINLPHTAFDNV